MAELGDDFGSQFLVIRFRRSEHAIEKIEHFFFVYIEKQEYSLDNVERNDFIMIVCVSPPEETYIGSSITLHYKYDVF